MKSDRLPLIPREIERRVEKAVEESARRIANQARATAPVRTGLLKESIDTRSFVRDNGARTDVVAVYYWQFMEFGTESHGEDGGPLPAQPFMTPAAEAERPRLVAEMKRALGNL